MFEALLTAQLSGAERRQGLVKRASLGRDRRLVAVPLETF